MLKLEEDARATGLVPGVGELHQKGATMQYHFAKLYLCSHVFRGIPSTAPIPEPLREAARSATTAAIDSIQLCLTDPDINGALRGMPPHIHAMLCFSCVFLLKLAVNRQDGLVDVDVASELATRLVQRFRVIQVSKWHPARFIADMLEKSAASYLGLRGTGSVKGKEARRGSGCGSGSGSWDHGIGNIMEEASQRALGLFPGSGSRTSVMHQSILEIDEEEEGGSGSGKATQGMPSSLESPSLAFGTPNFFDFGGGAQSGQEDDASGFR